MADGFSLYLHIPYCFHKCPYCDFNTYAVASIPEKEYVTALLSELDYRAAEAKWRGRAVETIYFGGGTPSIFSSSSIRKIIAAISKSFPVSEDVEISLEANPGTVTPESLCGYRDAGVNRLSFGSQSFNTTTLKKLGRMHSPDQVVAGVENARSAGFRNINLDLIYGVEGQSVNDVRTDLQTSLDLLPEHISAYGLTIEKGTPFYVAYKKGQMKLPKEAIIVEMMSQINLLLAQSGFRHYEISNYCKPGKEARHNMAYWEGHDYLGLGAGAHSFVKNTNSSESQDIAAQRWSNYALPAKYISVAIASGNADSWSDKLTTNSLIFEYFFLGLRKIAGVSRTDFQNRFGDSIDNLYPDTLQMLIEKGMLISKDDMLRLSDKGLLLSDSVIESFIEPDYKKNTKLVGNI